METSAPLINAIVSNALLHSSSCIKQMPPKIIHILHCIAAPDFVMKCIKARAVVARSLEVLWVSYIIALSNWRYK